MQHGTLRALPALGIFALAVTSPMLAQEHQHHHTPGTTADTSTSTTPLYQDLGTYSHKITTSSPKAQQYFDQGLRLTYAFNHEEAINSFREALKHDSTCAMCWWGIANALGPNINAPMDTASVKPAYEAIQQAKARANQVTPAERALIGATATRYAPDASADRAALDSAYAKTMKEVAAKHPNDPDAQTLYAESLMDLSPWNYWTDRGKTARPGTQEVVTTLERTIRKHPNHPGACHFYIHIAEASTSPGRALPCADRLAKLMPGAGHLVHMPTHIYMRLGRYDLVASHNHDAVAEDETYIQDRRPAGFYKFTYYPHNYHMLWAGLMNLGRGKETIETSRKLVSVVPVEVVGQAPPLEYFMPTPYFSLARFGKWDTLLAEPAPATELKYTTGMWRYTRGLALAAKGQPDEAQAERDSLTALAAAIPAEQPAGINSAKKLLSLAERHLAAKIAAARGDTAQAIGALQEAIRIEDELTYDEPPPWYHPMRQELGGLLLAAGQPARAERMFREDLEYWPNNGWSLSGLAKSLRAQKKDAEAAKVEQQFRKVWSGADIRLAAR